MDKTERQIADMDTLIARRVDAILVSPKVTKELTAAVSNAFNAGIPVFVPDGDRQTARDGDWKQDRGYDIMAEALQSHRQALRFSRTLPTPTIDRTGAAELLRANDLP